MGDERSIDPGTKTVLLLLSEAQLELARVRPVETEAFLKGRGKPAEVRIPIPPKWDGHGDFLFRVTCERAEENTGRG